MSDPVRELAERLRDRRVIALTGAGCSTESGIPDYRGPDSRWKGRQPILYQQFLRSPAARTRYWAGSLVGWPRVARARPNSAHRALARLERAGAVLGVITQNVDGLHRSAGSRRVVELHGDLRRVRCLGCGAVERRADVQRRLIASNPDWRRRIAGPTSERATLPDGHAELAPDGDAGVGLPPSGFRVPICRACGGTLKPDVVLFGENVPRDRVAAAWRLFEAGDALLVVGSSLAVYSGRRFVDRAAREGMPVAIVNLGATRGDRVACARVEAHAGWALSRLADALLPNGVSLRPPSSTGTG